MHCQYYFQCNPEITIYIKELLTQLNGRVIIGLGEHSPGLNLNHTSTGFERRGLGLDISW
jgi:hypothetical protein